MSIIFNRSDEWSSIQNSLEQLSHVINTSPLDAVCAEIGRLSEPTRHKIFQHAWTLAGEPGELKLDDVSLLDSKDRVLLAIDQTALDVFNSLDPLGKKPERLSGYARLLKMYTFNKSSPSAELRAHLDLLPEELRQNFFKHSQDLSTRYASRELDLLESLPILKQAIKEIVSEMVDSLPMSQKWVICSKRDKLLKAEGNACDPTYLQLQILDEFKLLLSPPQDPTAFVATLKTRSDLWKHVPTFISSLRIQNQEILGEIAELCAQHHPREVAENIKNFRLQGDLARVKIAKLCAQRDGLFTPENIANFNIQNEQDRIEIAKLCAEQSGIGTASQIKNFGIRNKQARIDIAKICAKQNGSGTAQYIRYFNIPERDQDALFEIAYLCEKYSPWGVAAFIQNFKIQSEKDRIELAILGAEKAGSQVADHIEKFNIEDQAALIKIAKLCAMQNAYTVAQRIQKFNIQDQAALIEIAKICAQNAAWGLVQFIQNFSITDKQALFEIAKLCAQLDGGATALHIQAFGITDNQALIEIAMLCAGQNGISTAERIKNFNIQESQSISLIGMQCLICSMGEAHVHLIQNIPEIGILAADFKSLFEAFKEQTLSKDPLVKSLRSFIHEHLGKQSPFLDNLTILDTIKDTYAQKQAGIWFAIILIFIATLDPAQQVNVFKTGLVDAFCCMRSPALRQNLSPIFMKFARDKQALELFLERPQDQDAKTRVFNLLLCSLQISGIAAKTTDAIRQIAFPVFRGGDREIRPLLEMLYILQSSQSLLPREKQWMLDELTVDVPKRGLNEGNSAYRNRVGEFRSKTKKTVIALLTLFLFNEEKWLIDSLSRLKFREGKYLLELTDESFLPLDEEALCKQEGVILPYVKGLLQEKLSLSKDLIDKLYEKLMPERNPTALMIYAAKLSSLNDLAVARDLGRYVNGVTTGTFQQDRYQLEQNPHLQQIAKNHALTLQNWQEALATKKVEFLPETPSKLNVREWLREKVINDGHMAPNQVPNLLDLINNRPVNEKDLSSIERVLKDLIFASSKEKQIPVLEKIKDKLDNLPSCEFRKNVVEQLEQLQKQPSNSSQEVFLVDTDDYFDLLMSGTEVAQSCQNVSGSPFANKGLLGYLLDGKNRILTVKDKQGKIMARAKLSLLWDGEKPALFLERLYTHGSYNTQCRQAITKMALDKAQALGLELVVLKETGYAEGKAFDKDLQAFESGVSYEYSDAMGGVQKDGTYTIPKTNLVELLDIRI